MANQKVSTLFGRCLIFDGLDTTATIEYKRHFVNEIRASPIPVQKLHSGPLNNTPDHRFFQKQNCEVRTLNSSSS